MENKQTQMNNTRPEKIKKNRFNKRFQNSFSKLKKIWKDRFNEKELQ